MAVEDATLISSLDPSLPDGRDPITQGDAHLRLLKAVLKAQFPNLEAAVTLSAATLNGLPARVQVLETLGLRAKPASTPANQKTIDALAHRLVNLADGVNPQDSVTLAQAQALRRSIIAPGFVLTTTNPANPSTYFGEGTWVNIGTAVIGTTGVIRWLRTA